MARSSARQFRDFRARSRAGYLTDPQGIAWEQFHTLGAIAVFSDDALNTMPGSACCADQAPRGKPIGIPISSAKPRS